MAIPTYATVLSQINTYIVANGNNEITANVLNPILELILDFANNTIGNLDYLTTAQKNTIVDAINSLKQDIEDIDNNAVQLLQGENNPNDISPAAFKVADFYAELDSLTSEVLNLWQYNGVEWINYSDLPATQSDNVQNNSTVAGSSVTDALETLAESSLKVPKIQFISDGITANYDIAVLAPIKAVFWNSVILNDDDWTQSGSEFTLTFTPTNGDIIKPI